ncbi:CoA-transferase [Serratia fonticola]|uniref:CoA-transferase n=1 Tax=Serratia fonticola TaxID=47917 RepID=UPI00398642E9
MEIVDSEQAAALIRSGATIIPGGFGSCGHPDSLTQAIEKRFLETGHPRDLGLLFASGAGESCNEGLNRFSHDGMVSSAVGGFWGLCPKLTGKVLEGKIEGHNWPQGVVSKLFTEIASGSPGVLTRIGLGTFVDPRLEGGVIGEGESLVSLSELGGREYLMYPSLTVDFALLRGTKADRMGNIDMGGEAAFHDACAQAMAVRKCGGKVIVQVESISELGIPARDVRIPGFLVDYVVVEGEGRHYPSYGHLGRQELMPEPALHDLIIAERASREVPTHGVVNFGIGIPALISRFINDPDTMSTTIESGAVGGTPWHGQSFGYADSPTAIMEQSALFTFYDGGGIDTAFLGFAEIDRFGCVNASRFGSRLTGAGGFINITQTARRIVFCGTSSAGGMRVEKNGEEIRILEEGKIRKFVDKVRQVTFDRKYTEACNVQEVLVITERAVFELVEDGRVVVREIYPGCTTGDLQNVFR